MKRDLDAIDRVLSEEEVVRPSSDFTARVMRQVRAEAEAPEPIEFPWRRFLPGMLTSLSLTMATFMVLGWFGAAAPAPPVSRPTRVLETLEGLQRGLATPTGIGLLCAGAALLLSGALAWWTLRDGHDSTAGF